MAEMIAAAHLVTVTTEALAKVYRRHNDHVVVLPNSVPDWLLEQANEPGGRAGRLVMGYTGSPSHADDFESWSRTYGRWMSRRAHQTTLRLYGTAARPTGMPLTWSTETVGWQTVTEDYLRSLNMDVGIAPLIDSAFNRGKSGIKALEYAALGIPSVCSDVQQYRDVVVGGQTGFLCRTPQDWLSAFGALWDSPRLRERLGAAGREMVRERYTQSRTAGLWEDAYLTAMERVGIKQ
jgi:glycosyltransferase involved in cell wall biosynthesis